MKLFLSSIIICCRNYRGDFVFGSDDYNTRFNLFHTTSSSLFNQAFPLENKSSYRKSKKPWITRELRERVKILESLRRHLPSVFNEAFSISLIAWIDYYPTGARE